MYKKVFMYSCLTMTVSLSAMQELPVSHERLGRQSELQAMAVEQQTPPWSIRQEGSSTIHEGLSDRVPPNLKVSIPGVGPLEATLSDNQTRYLSILAGVVVICCAVVVTEHPELIKHLLGQKQ